MKKYELIKQENGFFRIRALKSFGCVEEGELGGIIEKESNLSQYGNAWVYDDALVYGNAWVHGDAEVCDNAEVCGDALVYGNARVCGNARVYGYARVCDDARIRVNANVCGNAKVCGNAIVHGDAWVHGDVLVCDDSEVYGNAKVYGNAEVYGNAKVIGDITEPFLNIASIQCEKRLMTVYQDINGNVKCNIGCQKGMTLEVLERRIEENGGMRPHRKQYINVMKNAKTILNIE